MPEVMPWHVTELLNADYNRVDLVKEGANSQAQIMLFKSKGGISMNFEDVLKGLKPDHAAVITAHIDSITKTKDDAYSVLEKAKKDSDEALEAANIEKAASEKSEEEIIKGIKDPAVRALMEQQVRKTKAAEAEVIKTREATVNAEAIAKSKELAGIGSDEETLTGVYKSLTTLDVTVRDNVFGVLKAAQAVIAEGGLTTEIGKSAPGAGTLQSETDAWGAIETAATEIAKTRSIAQAAAITAVINEQPALYDAYMKAQQGN